MQNYRVQLDSYAGPMDLLLYLIRREEVDIYDIPISHVLEQYLQYVRLLEAMDPDGVGEFLVLAATLMEIKSRMLLPKPPPEEDGDDELDPRADLVRQLLAYRAFREAAGRLREEAETHAQRFPRPGLELPKDDGEHEVDIEDAQIWDLLTAFNKLLASVGAKRGMHEVLYDDTPISLHATDIQDRLERDGPAMPFEKIFEGRTRGEMIGLFLALLELIRQDRVRVEQSEQFGAIVVHLIDATPLSAISEELEDMAEAVDDSPDETDQEEEEEEDGVSEAVFADEEDEMEDDQDEFGRQIDSVKIAEIDLGRSFDRQPPTDDAESETLDADEQQGDSRS